MSRSAVLPEEDRKPVKFIIPNHADKVIRIPYEDYLVEEEKESFKVPKEFTVHVKGTGYNAFVRSFALFFSDKEVENGRFSKITRKFKGI